jgi:hypothetical protein
MTILFYIVHTRTNVKGMYIYWYSELISKDSIYKLLFDMKVVSEVEVLPHAIV